ncbi:MAG: hypothetical protein ACOH5I_14930 [Oligoflexus sp.]
MIGNSEQENMEDALQQMSSLIGQILAQFQKKPDVESPPTSTSFWYQPTIQLREGHLIVDGLIIPLLSRPKTLSLIEAFLTKPNLSLSRHEIIQQVYHHPRPEDLSPRLFFSCNQNILKLISRSRRLLEQATNCNLQNSWVEWFVHNESTKEWLLYRVHGQPSSGPISIS